MKLNELVGEFRVIMTNEESEILERMEEVSYVSSYNERERYVIENLIRKSLVSKVVRDGVVLVVRND